MNVLLQGIVGSTAYGLNNADSDIDRLGLYAADTAAFHGLSLPIDKAASHVTKAPDQTMHEARKFCMLALGCNPTIMELLWLPDDLYEVRTPLGNDLIKMRVAFLSATRVRDAYLGYCTQQFKRLSDRGDGSFSADTRKRTAKHARHLARLAHQGLRLYMSGNLEIQLDDPQRFIDFGEKVAAGNIDLARQMIADYEVAFNNTPPYLPAEPDRARVEAWLQRVRAAHWRTDALV